MTDTWSMIATERRALADQLESLRQEQWSTPSLCAGWTVRDVVAHLVFPMRFSTVGLLLRVARAGFDLDKVNNEEAHGDRRTPEELIAALRANAEHRFHPPTFGPEAPLTDVLMHGQDVRRPLGIAYEIDPAALDVVLDLLVSRKATRGFLPKGRTDGLRFEASDLGWAAGAGPVVRGKGEALAMALTGRKVVLPELEGDGVAALSSRLA